jgi:hypothetical protein
LPLIWIICYDICLTRLKQEDRCFNSTVFPMNASPTIETLLGKTQSVKIQLTSFMDNLAIFFNNCEDIIRGTGLITSFNSLVVICTNPNKSPYITYNWSNNNPFPIGNTTIHHATPRTPLKILGDFFSKTLGTCESLHNAKSYQ